MEATENLSDSPQPSEPLPVPRSYLSEPPVIMSLAAVAAGVFFLMPSLGHSHCSQGTTRSEKMIQEQRQSEIRQIVEQTTAVSSPSHELPGNTP